MNYEWNLIKERLNIAKHGVDFEEAKSVFADEFALVLFDEDHSNDEERFLILGMSQKERILLVVHCYRENDTIRIISSRKATKNETKQYNIRSENEKRIRLLKSDKKSVYRQAAKKANFDEYKRRYDRVF